MASAVVSGRKKMPSVSVNRRKNALMSGVKGGKKKDAIVSDRGGRNNSAQ